MPGASAATVHDLPPAPAYRLPGVHLFASGTYRGEPYPPARTRTIATNIRRHGPSGTKLLIPPAVLGHEERQEWLEETDLPAAGWVDPDTVHAIPDPKYPGEVLVIGDVVNVPREVAERIKAGEFANGSVEFYELHDDFGKPQGYTLRRFGLLGGEVPQVKRLGRLPQPVPMDAVKVFAESVETKKSAVVPKGGAAFKLAFSERQTMDRTSAYAAIKASMPGLSQATLDAMSDDAINELVANLPAPTAPVVTPPPAMAEVTPEEMAAALVAAGQDQALVAAMTPEDLKAAYDLVKPPAMSEDEEQKKKEEEAATAKMSEAQRRALADSKKATADLVRFTEQQKRDLKAALVEPVCDDLIKSGFTPAFVAGWVKPQLLSLDNTLAIHRFSENGQTKVGTAFQTKLAEAKNLKRLAAEGKVFVKFGEKLPGGGTNAGSPEARKSAALEKAREHAATVPEAAWKQTSFGSGQGFVTKFSETFDKNPEGAMQMIG